MIHEDATPHPASDGSTEVAPIKTFDAAISAVMALATALRAAIADIAFEDAARLRGELARALARATMLAENLADAAERADAVDRLGEARGVALDLFQIAPTPSAAALAAAESRDRVAWIREEQAWVTDRLARGTNPRLRSPRRARRDTRPECPIALHMAAIKEPAAVAELSSAAIAEPSSATITEPSSAAIAGVRSSENKGMR